jgi:predicted ATP-grasp superfamily ATP-dependent carboligase
MAYQALNKRNIPHIKNMQVDNNYRLRKQLNQLKMLIPEKYKKPLKKGYGFILSSMS